VRDYNDAVAVGRTLVSKRVRLSRHGYARPHRVRHASVRRVRSYVVSERLYGHRQITGRRPLPYEFGPWDSSVVVLRP
jgi:hypothetical protein